MLLKLRYNPDSNLTLSAKLLKIKQLYRILDVLSGTSFVFGMSDMQSLEVLTAIH